MLITGNIILRRLNENDKIAMSQLLNNKKVCDNLRDYVPFPYTEDDAINFINFTKEEDPQRNFAIEFEGNLCGMIGLIPLNDVYKRTAEIGYWIGEPYWGKGIATEALRMITEYGFTELNVIRIHTGVFEYNPASMRVLEKNGYKKDCVFEKAILKNGKIWDEHRFSKIIETYTNK